MSVVRRLARPMFASIFITGGLDALRHPASKAPAAEKIAPKIAEKVSFLPNDTEQLVRIDAAVKVGAGVLFALNRFPRIAALALAGSMVPTTLAGHPFWQEKDAQKRKMQQIHFFKNLSLVGGALLAATDTDGKPSLAWRAKRAPGAIGHAAHDLRRDAELSARSAVGSVKSGAGSAVDSVKSGAGSVWDKLPI